MVTKELVEKLEKAEVAVCAISPTLPLPRFMKILNEKEKELFDIIYECCEAIYQQTKDINSRDTIFSVYGGINNDTKLPRLHSSELKKFLKS